MVPRLEKGIADVEWFLMLTIWTVEGTVERYEPTPMAWNVCRLGEMKQAMGWRGHYDGGEIILAKCVRVSRPQCAGVCG